MIKYYFYQSFTKYKFNLLIISNSKSKLTKYRSKLMETLSISEPILNLYLYHVTTIIKQEFKEEELEMFYKNNYNKIEL